MLRTHITIKTPLLASKLVGEEARVPLFLFKGILPLTCVPASSQYHAGNQSFTAYNLEDTSDPAMQKNFF